MNDHPHALREFTAGLFGRRLQADTAPEVVNVGNHVPEEGKNPTPHPAVAADLRAFAAELFEQRD